MQLNQQMSKDKESPGSYTPSLPGRVYRYEAQSETLGNEEGYNGSGRKSRTMCIHPGDQRLCTRIPFFMLI